MSSCKTDIIIIRGAPGSGKSQTAKCLSKSFPKGVRMEIDNLRSMVISADWTNQKEHIDILNLSTRLVFNFLQLGFRPIIIVDTFSGNKMINYIEKLYQSNESLNIRIFGLFSSEDELTRRIESRKNGEFKDLKICLHQNSELTKAKFRDEIQIDTTGSLPKDTAKTMFDSLI